MGDSIRDRRIFWPPLVLVAALGAVTLVRLWVAAAIPLVPDEAYYWVWSRALAPGYLDHPPMVALWIRAGTWLAGESALGVRLLGPVSAALGSILLYDAAERLFPGRRAGLTAVVLLNATLVLAVGSVVMTPDTPLLLFWTAALWTGARIAAGGNPAWWLAAGVMAGLALDSKYTAAFLPVGLGLFVLFASPRTLRRPEPYAGALIAAALFAPVLIWNASHHWAGFLKQGGRAANWRPDRAATFLSELVFGQIGLATPGIFLLFAAGLGVLARPAARGRDKGAVLLTMLSVPPILVFVQHAIGDRVQGNWPAILYPAAAIAAAGLTAPRWRRLTGPSAVLGAVLSALAYIHAVSVWPAFPGAADPAVRQLAGWDRLAAGLEQARRAAGVSAVIAEPFGPAAELAWTSPQAATILGTGDHWDLTVLPRVTIGDAPVLLIRPERYGPAPDPAFWPRAEPAGSLERTGPGGGIERYSLFLVRAADPRMTAAVLPRR